MAARARPRLLPRLLAATGALLLVATLILGLVLAEDVRPHSLAGSFLTAFLPAALGFSLLAGGVTLQLVRRWWRGCLSLPVLAVLGIVVGMGGVLLYAQRKLAEEEQAVVRRCRPLQEALEEHRARAGEYPADLGGPFRGLARLCGLEIESLGYATAGGTYLLTVPASSVDVDMAVFFAGPRGVWSLLGNDRRQRLEEQLRTLSVAPLDDDDPAVARYAALWGQVHPEFQSSRSPLLPPEESPVAGAGTATPPEEQPALAAPGPDADTEAGLLLPLGDGPAPVTPPSPEVWTVGLPTDVDEEPEVDLPTLAPAQ